MTDTLLRDARAIHAAFDAGLVVESKTSLRSCPWRPTNELPTMELRALLNAGYKFRIGWKADADPQRSERGGVMADLILWWSSSQQMGNADRNALGHAAREGERKTLCGCPVELRKPISRFRQARCWETMGEVIGVDVDESCVSCRKCRRIAKLDDKETP